MRLCGALLIVLGACYGPSYAPGAPCDPVLNNCPTGIECLPDGIGHSCGGGMEAPIDAAIDGAVDIDAAIDGPPSDPDGDGIIGANDNCPTIANASQHNEDSDALGDVCDPCPVSTTNTDADGDGIGNDCDPRPNMPGDTLVLFEPFATTIPAAWNIGVGSWTVVNDELRITGSATPYGLRTNIPATSRMMAVTSVVPDTVTAGGSIGITNPYASASGGGGILCSLFQPAAGSREISVYDLTTDVVIDNHTYAWVDDVPYILAAVRVDTSYSCLSIGSAVIPPPQGNSSTTVTGPVIGLRSDGVTARFQWLMIIQMP